MLGQDFEFAKDDFSISATERGNSTNVNYLNVVAADD